MKFVLAFACMAIPTSSIAAPVPKELKKVSQDQFQGDWVLVACESNSVIRAVENGYTWTIRGDTGSVRFPENPISLKFALKFDMGRSPITMTSTRVDNCRSYIFIVKIEGEILYECFCADDSSRVPEGFHGSEKNVCNMYKRVAK